MKNFQQFSLVSRRPAPFTSLRTPEMMFSTSSSGKRSGISPDASMSLISTRKFSLATCASVIRNMIPTFFKPAFRYNPANSVCVNNPCQFNHFLFTSATGYYNLQLAEHFYLYQGARRNLLAIGEQQVAYPQNIC